MSSPSLAVEPLKPSRAEVRWLALLLIVASLLRLGVVCWKSDLLAEDRDLYWGIAERLAAGDGFQHPTLGHATAYRPPLYPLILARIIAWGGGVFGLTVVQTGFSVATVWLTYSLGRSLSLGRCSMVAAAFVAANPLLIHANSQAMTETVCTFLVMAALRVATAIHNVAVRKREYSALMNTLGFADNELDPRTNWSLLKPFGLGLLCGLAALTRPTVLAFVTLAAAIVILRQFCHGWPTRAWLANCIVASVTFGLTLAPWGLRNVQVFGSPIITTTHGGYTLLLGNNDEAYRDEISKPFGTLWDSRPWQQSLEADLRTAGIAPHDEIARDRWMSQRAWEWIGQHPREFAAACWLRARRFWNISPSGADATVMPHAIRWGVAVFFVLELTAAAIGLWRIRRDDWSVWWPLVVLVVSFSTVHLVYWSNLRMRAPVEPVLALLAVHGVFPHRPGRHTGVE